MEGTKDSQQTEARSLPLRHCDNCEAPMLLIWVFRDIEEQIQKCYRCTVCDNLKLEKLI